MSIDETMNEIKRNWNVTLQEDLNPIPISLELLQNSNPAHDYESFARLHQQLETCMEAIIENNYSGFNGAVSTFGGIVDNVKECKKVSGLIRSNLQEFRDQIQYKRADLPDLWGKIEQFKLRISALGTLAEMKRMRGEARELVKKRFFVPAARILVGILTELEQIGQYIDSVDKEFVRDLREDREQFLERLLEEFCQHVFFRAAPASIAQLVNQAIATFPGLAEHPSEFVNEQKRQLLVVPEGDLVMIPTEFNYNPESNAQAYLLSLFQAAECLGCLGDLTNAIEQRLSAELFQLADADLKAINRRYHRDRLGKKGSYNQRDDNLLLLLPSQFLSHHDQLEIEAFAPFLKLYMDTLLMKFAVVLSVFHLVCHHETEHADEEIQLRASLFSAAGKAVHHEVRNVLGTFLKGKKMALQLKQQQPEDPSTTGVLFKMLSSEEDADGAMSLGGIGSLLSAKEKGNAKKFAKMIIVDPFSTAKEEFGHHHIVKASLQYLPIIFPCFAFFMQAFHELGLASATDADFQFLQQYIREDFIPFLEGHLTQELTIVFNSPDAMSPERVKPEHCDLVLIQGKHADQIPRAFKAFLGMVNLLLRLAVRIPNYREAFEGLIRRVCTLFMERSDHFCPQLSHYSTNGKGGDAPAFLCCKLAADGDLRGLLQDHPFIKWASNDAVSASDSDTFLLEKEIVMMERLKGDRSLGHEEVIFDRRAIQNMILFQRGFALASEIILPASSIEQPWLVPYGPSILNSGLVGYELTTGHGAIELSKEFGEFFTGFLDHLAGHALSALISLRLEVKIHTIYYLDLSLREGDYSLEEPNEAVDPYIQLLAKDLIRLNSLLAAWLPFNLYYFCVESLTSTIQAVLINGYRQIKDINEYGYLKLQSGLRALEQVLALVSHDGDDFNLDRVRAYYVLAQAGPKTLLEGATACEYKFTFEQYKAILDSFYQIDKLVDETEEDADEASLALRKEYQNQLVRLQYFNH